MCCCDSRIVLIYVMRSSGLLSEGYVNPEIGLNRGVLDCFTPSSFKKVVKTLKKRRSIALSTPPFYGYLPWGDR